MKKHSGKRNTQINDTKEHNDMIIVIKGTKLII